VSSLYAAILSATGTPLRLLERLVSSLIRLILGGSDEEPVATSTINAARALLSLVHQRHVDILRDAVGEIIDDGESEHEGDDQRTKKKERKKKADELMISLSMVGFLSVSLHTSIKARFQSHPWAQSTDVNEIVVASTSSAKEARVGAVERLYKILQGGLTLESSDRVTLSTSLFLFCFTNISILRPQYSQLCSLACTIHTLESFTRCTLHLKYFSRQ
jgi:U3 small nucleolar RNA-associated protein 10